ncbi:MAG: ABC transporter permease [Calditrichia bacterium]|nr:ABC transporter permease [Calditrichia bacterium]
MKTLALIQLTFKESLAKKTFLAFFGISTLISLLFIFALNLDIVDGAQAYISVFGQETNNLIELDKIVATIEGAISIFLFTGGIFMALFATSNLIPSFLEPGTIDLLISKPLSRMQIFLGRYAGAIVIVAFNIFYLIIFTWLVISFKTGIWNFSFLLSGIIIVITFAVLYSLMAFLGLITTSGAFSLMITYLILFFSPLLLQRDNIYALLSNKIYGYLLDGLYYILPKTAQLSIITQNVVNGTPVSSWMPLWSSILFGVGITGISVLIFKRKNF